MIRDLRHGLRMLSNNPGFTAIAVITLAFGIGANTVIFSGVYAFFLSPLPYADAGRLVVISQATRQGFEYGISYPDFADWKVQKASFEQMAASRTISMHFADSEPVERMTGSRVSKEFFPLLGGRAWLGRTFLGDDFLRGNDRTILLSHRLWQRRFGSDETIIGKSLKLDNEEFTVIGVMPKSFQYPFRSEFWTPLEASEKAELLQDRAANNYEVIALLKPGVSADRAAGELAIPERAAEQETTVRVKSLRDTMRGLGKYRTPALVLQLAVLFVLLIASANLANLLLARNAARRQEFVIRLALGAGPRRLIRQLLSENMLLGLFGSLAGLLLAFWGIRALRSIISFRVPGASEVEINMPVLGVTLIVSLLTSLGFGLVPAILASRQDLNSCLKSAAGSVTSDQSRRRLSRMLVIAEVALAVVLLAASGLMIRTFLNLTKEDPGFNPDRAIALSLSLSPSEYSNYESLASHLSAIIGWIKAVPGVESVGGVTYLPLIGYNPGIGFAIEGRPKLPPEEAPRADFQPVTPGYFQAMGISLLRGRQFTEADMKPQPEVVIINNALARRVWPEGDPLGEQIRLYGSNAPEAGLAVIGIVDDVKQFGLHTDPRPEVYLPGYRHSMSLIVRASAESGGLPSALGEAVSKTDNKAAYSIKAMEQVVADSLEKRRIFAMQLGTLAVVALVMAAMGIYGVISFAVAQRTREIGIRIAVGAGRRDILELVVTQGMSLAIIGVMIGLAAAVAFTRVLKSLLYGVSTIDPLVFAGLALLIMALAFVASYVPARRATRVDPMVALRCE